MNGSFANQGLTLTQTPDSPAWIYFMGHRGPIEAQRPSLTVEFTPVPEPGSIALVGLGLAGVLGLARRQRRIAPVA